MQRWQIGDVRITKVTELEMPGPGTFILPEATPEALLAGPSWLRPHFVTDEGQAILSIHSFVVESSGARILVDTCVGNDKPRPIPDWDRRQGPFLQDLEAAGFPVESIDRVLCTHLHVDHVGWNTRLVDGRFVPTFPSARYLIGRREWDYWSKEPEDVFGAVMEDSVKPLFDAGQVDLVGTDLEITPELRLEPTPGHTPGHVSLHIRSAGEEAVITGDLMHHPVQCARPDWGSHFDVDPEQALATRRAFLERYGDRSVLVLGTHFAGATAGRLVRDGASWRFEPAT